ncbi:MAG: right-handed parallel beta-helix repeat-containing protein [Verrucomicrobiota bacterium]
MKLPAFICSMLMLSSVTGLVAADIYVAVDGSDSNIGSKKAPLRTIQAAADKAQPGDVVLVGPGIYRERVSPPQGGLPDNPIIFRSLERYQAVIKGSDLWSPAWKKEGGRVWSGFLESSLFTDLSHTDGANPFDIPFSVTPRGREGRPESRRGNPKADPNLVYNLGQVFVDGDMYMQAPLKSEMEAEPGTWFYDSAGKTLYINFFKDGPGEHVVEITTRRRIFAPHERGLGFIEVDGFVMEHCGNQYPFSFAEQDRPECQQAGALGTRSGHDWVIRNNIVRRSSGIGIDLGEEGFWGADLEKAAKRRSGVVGSHTVENNYIIDNGASGIAAYNANHLTIRGNVLIGNNAWGFSGPGRTESSGIKLTTSEHAIIEHNYIAENIGRSGISFDGGAGLDARIVRNVVVGHEVGAEFVGGVAKDALVAANVFIENKTSVSIREAGGLTVMNNMFLGSDGYSIKATVDSKREGKWSASNLAFYNNVMKGRGIYVEITTPDSYRSEGRAFDYNVYDATPKDLRWRLAGGSADLAFSNWTDAWKKMNRGVDAEQRSVAIKGILYVYDPAKTRLTVLMPLDPVAVGAYRDKRLLTDFFGATIGTDGGLRTGPFKQLQMGRNEIVIWAGIPIPPKQSPWARAQ